MVGSNILTRLKTGKSQESCVSLVYRLLVAGGLENLVGGLEMFTVGSQNALVVKPDTVLEQILLAKLRELETKAETKEFIFQGESKVETLINQHAEAGITVDKINATRNVIGCKK